MKGIVLFGLIAIAVSAAAEEKYTDKYDNFDLKELENNDRLAMSYINCMKGKGPCTPEGKELKSHITEALETECAKCTDKQKDSIDYVLGVIINKYPTDWEELRLIFDPNQVFIKKYEDRLKKIQQQ